jgi:hypothetical protein
MPKLFRFSAFRFNVIFDTGMCVLRAMQKIIPTYTFEMNLLGLTRQSVYYTRFEFVAKKSMQN